MRARTVLISGLGIAGPTLAYWLNAAGFAPTVVERAPALRTGGYVIDFWGLGYDIADRMGLAGTLDREGYHAREMRIVGDDGGRIAGFGVDVFASLTGGRYVTVGRSDLSRLLFETIAGSTEVMLGDAIAALRDDSDGVEVEFDSGACRRFDLVVGADGLHSNVRRLVFGPEKQFERHLGYWVAAFQGRGYRTRDEDVYVMHNQPGRMLGRFALHDDRTLFLFVFADGDRSLAGADPKALLRERYRGGGWESDRILEALDGADDLYFDPVSQIKMPRWSSGRVALIGDAAFCISLMGGQGSALAMIAAYVLAGELARADGDHRPAFDTYERLLTGYIDGKRRGAERFSAAFAPRTAWGLQFRNLVIAIFAVPGLARLMFGGMVGDTLRLPEYRWR